MNEHVNMANFIAAKSDQLTADDLTAGPRTITITRVTGNEGNADQPVNFYFEGDDGKPFRPCKIMRRVIVAIWGPNAASYVGKSMTVFRDAKVKWGGMEVGGIRISHMSGLEERRTLATQETRGVKKAYVVQPLKDVPAKSGDDAAGRWANSYLAKVKTCATLEVLDAFVAEKATRLAELKDVLPNAHGQCVAAVDEKRKELSPNDGTLSDDNPTAAEGPADEQRGDQFADDPWASEED